MDIRILDKIEELEIRQSSEIENQRLDRLKKEEYVQKNIASKMPAARQFVEDVLFDEIAKAHFQGLKELNLKTRHMKYNGVGMDIPVESIAAAAAEIEGLTIVSVWVPEWTGHLNSDEITETIPAHYDYSVTWGDINK